MDASSEAVRLLILGSMDEFVELVQRARARGMYTVVCDGYDDGPAKAFADAAYTIDIRDVDALVAVCQQERIDAVLSSFSDILFESSCKLSHAAGLPTPCSLESLRFLRDKGAMKAMFSRLGIESPRSVLVREGFQDADIAQLHFPCVMKPLDGYGSRGVVVIDSPEEVRHVAVPAIASSTGKEVLFEEYQQGYEFNMTTWVFGGEVHVISIADREKSIEIPGELPHVSRIVYPSIYFRQVAPAARDIVQRIADYLDISEGPLSMQFFWTPESGIQVCEVAGRLFGYEHELVELSTGLALEDVLLDSVSDRAALQRRLQDHDPN
ncbi:MAG: ATP-grasp domain-containing protein, partial [Raoultibacter sp.]